MARRAASLRQLSCLCRFITEQRIVCERGVCYGVIMVVCTSHNPCLSGGTSKQSPTPTILVFFSHIKRRVEILTRSPSTETFSTDGLWKIRDFWPTNIRLYLGNDTRKGRSYYV